MPKDAGEKANRLAELRRAWYERPVQSQKSAKTSVVEEKTGAEPDSIETEAAQAKKGRRGKKPASEQTPLETALSEQPENE